jgi:hypothetical protein
MLQRPDSNSTAFASPGSAERLYVVMLGDLQCVCLQSSGIDPNHNRAELQALPVHVIPNTARIQTGGDPPQTFT